MSNNNLDNITHSLDMLGTAIGNLANQDVSIPEPADRSISGNKINGGMITNFRSAGIQDNAKITSLLVEDNSITVDAIDTKRLKGNPIVEGNLNVQGELTVTNLHVNKLSADVSNERTSSLEFRAENGTIAGKGLIWVNSDKTDQLIVRENQNKRLWSTMNIDLHQDQSYMIDNVQILSFDTLGASVKTSSLTKLGVVKNLRTSGNLCIDDAIFYTDESERLGIGTDQPNGLLSVANEDNEIILEPGVVAKLGTFNTGDLDIITDNTTRIKVGATGNISLGTNNEAMVTVKGKLGVGVNNPSTDASVTTAGPIRMQGKKMEVSSSAPVSGTYRKGDIVWNDNPQPTGYVGWICVRDGNPGSWKPFGQISK